MVHIRIVSGVYEANGQRHAVGSILSVSDEEAKRLVIKLKVASVVQQKELEEKFEEILPPAEEDQEMVSEEDNAGYGVFRGIPSLTSEMADMLEKFGISTVEGLAGQTQSEISEILGVSKKAAKAIVDEAKELLS